MEDQAGPGRFLHENPRSNDAESAIAGGASSYTRLTAEELFVLELDERRDNCEG